MDRTAFEASIASLSDVFIVILFDFFQPKNHSLNCPADTIHGTFSIVGLAIVPLKLYWLIKVYH